MNLLIWRSASLTMPLVFAISTSVFAAVNAPEGDWETMSLLEGRLTVLMPPGSRFEPREPDIMSAPESASDESRLVYEEGAKRLVVVAHEKYFLAGSDLVDQLRKQFDESDIPEARRPVFEAVGDKRVYYEPKAPGEERRMSYLRGLYYTHSDGSVQHLGLYISPEFNSEFERAEALARKILTSIADGPRALDLVARIIATDMLAFDVPAGFIHDFRDGPDFRVDHITPLATLDNPSGIGIYSGGHPAPHFDELEPGQVTITKIPGRLLGKPVEWIRYEEKRNGGNVFMEVIMRAHSTLKFHIWITATDEEQLESLISIAETARIIRNAPRR